MNIKDILVYVNLAATCIIGAYVFASKNHNAGSSELSGLDNLEAQVAHIIQNNPEAIIKSVEQHHMKKYQEEMKKSSDAVKAKTKELGESKNDPRMGAKNPKVRVIEFFDYNCGYCKRMVPIKEKIFSELKEVEVVFKELPILGESSMDAAKAALAVFQVAPEKYFQFHSELMKHNGAKSKDFLEAKAKEVGVDIAAYKKALDSATVKETLEANRKIAEEVGINGTPAYIINDELVTGAISYEEIKAKAHASGK